MTPTPLVFSKTAMSKGAPLSNVLRYSKAASSYSTLYFWRRGGRIVIL
jgi:hypothetical protein